MDNIEANKIIKFWIKKKEKIGFTNGCFDYLTSRACFIIEASKRKMY